MTTLDFEAVYAILLARSVKRDKKRWIAEKREQNENIYLDDVPEGRNISNLPNPPGWNQSTMRHK